MRVGIVVFLALCLHVYAFDEPFSYDPFVKARTLIQKSAPAKTDQAGKKRETISLSAIMSSRAFINGKWYALGDKFGTYKVHMVRPNMVGLKRGGKVKIVALGNQKNVLTIKEKE